jgi:hypothetical protein
LGRCVYAGDGADDSVGGLPLSGLLTPIAGAPRREHQRGPRYRKRKRKRKKANKEGGGVWTTATSAVWYRRHRPRLQGKQQR